jgi:hypothetical protein
LPNFSVQWSIGQMLPIYPCHVILWFSLVDWTVEN